MVPVYHSEITKKIIWTRWIYDSHSSDSLISMLVHKISMLSLIVNYERPHVKHWKYGGPVYQDILWKPF